MATMDALVHDGTFAIDSSALRVRVDRVKIGEHFYSSKPPMLSVLGAGPYAVLHYATGLSFRGDMAQATWVLNLLLGGVPHLILLAYAYALLRLYSSGHALVWAFACFAFGQLGLSYATTFNNHVPAAAAALASFYYAVLVRTQGSRTKRDWVLAGVAAALAPTFDLAAMFISIGIGLYLLTYDWRRTLRLFATAGTAPVAIHFALTYAISGSLRPISTRPELYRYPGSYWNAPTGLDALDEPRGTYLFNMLLGHHGFFSMTPVLFVAVAAIALAIARRGPRFPEACLAGGSLAASIVFYALTTKNYGGNCVGFRWLLPVTPIVLLFVADWLSSVRHRAAWVAFAVLLAISQFHVLDGLRNPWQASRWDDMLQGTSANSRQSRR